MIFQINHIEDPAEPEINMPALSMWQWRYARGTEEKPGEAICQSARSFDSERACRADIAIARKAFSGGRFAKVVNA